MAFKDTILYEALQDLKGFEDDENFEDLLVDREIYLMNKYDLEGRMKRTRKEVEVQSQKIKEQREEIKVQKEKIKELQEGIQKKEEKIKEEIKKIRNKLLALGLPAKGVEEIIEKDINNNEQNQHKKLKISKNYCKTKKYMLQFKKYLLKKQKLFFQQL